VPTVIVTASRNGSVKAPATWAIGTATRAIRATMSLTIMVRRRDQRSTQAPAARPMNSHGSQIAADSAPIAMGPACRSMIATRGMDTAATEVPRALVVSPTQSNRSAAVRMHLMLGRQRDRGNRFGRGRRVDA
jgi:hypothetical protein